MNIRMTCLKKLIAQNHTKSSKHYLHPTLPLTRGRILSKEKDQNLPLINSEDN